MNPRLWVPSQSTHFLVAMTKTLGTKSVKPSPRNSAQSQAYQNMDQREIGLDRFQSLSHVGVLGKVWPASRVLLGMSSCRWIHGELPAVVESVMLVASNRGIGSGAVMESSATVGDALFRFRKAELNVSWVGKSPELLLDGIQHAIVKCARSGEQPSLHMGTLDLRQTSIALEQVGKLASSLGRLSGLVSLDLSGHGIGEQDAQELANGLMHCKSLEHLDLSDNTKYPMLGAEGTGMIAKGIGSCERLRFLDLSRNLIGDAGAKQLAAEIGACTSLSHLGLAWNRLVHEGVGSIMAGLRGCTALTSLNLRGNFVADRGVRRLVAELEQGEWRIQHLDLSDNEVGEDGVSRLEELRAHTTCLKYVDLNHNQVEDVGGPISRSNPPDQGLLSRWERDGWH